MTINIDKFAFQMRLMPSFFKYILQILTLVFFLFSNFFQPLKVVDPDHPLAALVRKAQSDNNSSTPQSTDGAAVQTSQAEYSSDCKCIVIRQLVLGLDEVCVVAAMLASYFIICNCYLFFLNLLNLWSYLFPLSICWIVNSLARSEMGWREWAGRRPSLQSVSTVSTEPFMFFNNFHQFLLMKPNECLHC